MSIIWEYPDKRSAAIAAIKDYEAMRFIIRTTNDVMKKEYDKMASIGGIHYGGMPMSHNPQAAEERIINCIDKINVLKGTLPSNSGIHGLVPSRLGTARRG